jgi:N-acetylneuraminic acid mutarotase
MKRILLITVLFLSIFAIMYMPVLVFSSAQAVRADSSTDPTALNMTNDDRWERLEDMTVSRGHPGVAVVNGKIHAISGYNPDGSRNYSYSQEIYDPLTDTWQLLAGNVETPRADFVTLNFSDTIYTIGGYAGSDPPLDFNHIYDPISGTWDMENETPLPTSVSGAGGVVLNDKIYVLGGYRGETEGNTNEVQIYDPATKQWDVGIPMNTARSQFVAVVLDGLIYVIGGNYQGDDAFDVEIFDPTDGTTGAWREGTPLPERRRYMAGAVRQGEIYVVGGRNLGGDYMDTMFVYDPETEEWVKVASMPTARGACRAAVVNDTIYVIGGQSDVPGAGTANEAYGSFSPLTYIPLVIR